MKLARRLSGTPCAVARDSLHNVSRHCMFTLTFFDHHPLISKKQYAALSEFRFRLTQFQRFSQAAARESGISPLQYLLLLHLRGFDGRDWATVGELAERLDASHQGTVALVKRCASNGLVTKRRSVVDGRRVEIHLTSRARKLVERIAFRHLDELERLVEVLRVTVRQTYRSV